MSRRRWENLPQPVATHIDKKLDEMDWEQILGKLMSACSGCPARKQDFSPEPCQNCPVHAVTWSAARLWAAWKSQQKDSQVREFYESLGKRGKGVKPL